MNEVNLEEYLKGRIVSDCSKLFEMVRMSLSYTSGKNTVGEQDYNLLLLTCSRLAVVNSLIKMYEEFYPNNPDIKEVKKEVSERLGIVHKQIVEMLCK